jgi:hypothetical protein
MRTFRRVQRNVSGGTLDTVAHFVPIPHELGGFMDGSDVVIEAIPLGLGKVLCREALWSKWVLVGKAVKVWETLAARMLK